MPEIKVVKLLGSPVEITLQDGITPLGEYDNGTAYTIGDSVSYLGTSYIALGSTTGNLPTDPLYWQVLAEKGEQGDVGPPGTTDHLDLLNIGVNTHSQIDSHILSAANPHSVTKTQVGLGNVPNVDTSTTANITDSTNKRFVTDAEKTVLGNTSGVNTGDQDLSGKENVGVAAGLLAAHEAALDPHPQYLTSTEGDSAYEPVNPNIQSHIANTSNPHGVNKAQVGLSNVDNTSDASKPVSIAQQTAIDGKISKSVGPTYTTNSILTLTQAEYDAIPVKDASTLYFIVNI